MIQWVINNANLLGGGVMAICSLAGAAWLWLQNARKEKAKTGADVAIAESQREVYEQMKERLAAQEAHLQRLQGEVDELRVQLRERDTKIHSLELYITDLQHILHTHGIDVPPMRS